ncbi:pyridoxal 5'-phosphate synthase [Hyalangium sp.]|uniref:pyridoxine/pyridoxamine 5'-phosphate oxidase n=1 Tax=Hyalangium sp. TaxID=2028555 RepID=UPI002D6DE036|nr:pyridoxal 5'-phosphate synthase [Hyalangium sp.]HYI00075.1 pyridoxal 5'-phosphate synthase [Hyalangium sp.]
MSQRKRLRELPVLQGPLPRFDTDTAPAEPVALFEQWLAEAIAAGVPEPHAMTVSTVDEEGHPAARVLILKDVSAEGWAFASSRESAKGSDLAQTPWAALTFYWPLQGRQVRVRGPVITGSAEQNAADFLARHPAARAAVFSGRQSQPLPSRQVLEDALAEAQRHVAEEPGRVAPVWTVYTVQADRVEFWQGHPHRMHTRLRYRQRAEGPWERELLWP